MGKLIVLEEGVTCVACIIDESLPRRTSYYRKPFPIIWL